MPRLERMVRHWRDEDRNGDGRQDVTVMPAGDAIWLLGAILDWRVYADALERVGRFAPVSDESPDRGPGSPPGARQGD